MENTLENKAKFFALYWHQLVLIRNINNTQYDDKIILSAYNYDGWLDKSVLELKPLSSISDEDAIHVANLLWGNAWKATREELIETGKYRVERGRFGSCEGYFQDYFRTKGYALPYMDLSVEELVNRGWVKLKGENK